MEIFDALKGDHEQVLDLLDDLSETDETSDERQAIFIDLKRTLIPHMEAEEQYFYKILLAEGEDRRPVLEAIEEHRAAKKVISELDTTPVTDETWGPKLKVLKELITYHIEEEEDEIFDLGYEIMDDERAEEVADRFIEIEQEILAKI